MFKAARGSAGPSCWAQNIVSPPLSLGTYLVCGMWKVVTLLPFLPSTSCLTSAGLICISVSKLVRFWMVNSRYSPRRAAVKKVVVRHAKTAASSGWERFKWACAAVISSMRRGRRFGRLSSSGVDFLAPFNIVWKCRSSIFQGILSYATLLSLVCS